MINILYPKWSPIAPNLSLSDSGQIIKININHFPNIAYESFLSISELRKANRFINLMDKKRYVIGKYFLRLTLSKILNIPTDKIEYHQVANKKPAIEGVYFNLSHSGAYVVIAISTHAIGIDIEYLNYEFGFKQIIGQYFSSFENEWILSRQHPLLEFYTLWTRKEALLKATGEGLTERLDLVEVGNHFITRNDQEFQINSIQTEDGYVISLANNSRDQEIKFWELLDKTIFF